MEHRALQQERLNGGGESKGWSGESLGRLYAECCRTREEKGIERVRRAFKVRHAHVSRVRRQLTNGVRDRTTPKLRPRSST